MKRSLLLLSCLPLTACKDPAEGPGAVAVLSASAIAGARFVAFASEASNLVTGDSNDATDVFVHDRLLGTTERVSVSATGEEGNAYSGGPTISSDGRFVAFSSLASNLVPDDTNGTYDVLVKDRLTGAAVRATVSSSGEEAVEGGGVGIVQISSNGRYVTFESGSMNLVPEKTHSLMDIFVHDLQTRETTRVSVGTDGTEVYDTTYGPTISGDGRYVAFISQSLLVPNPSGEELVCNQVYLHDRQTHTTSLISTSSAGEWANGHCGDCWISRSGRHVVFTSVATNLAPGDVAEDYDVFLHDTLTGETIRVSSALDGGPWNGGSSDAQISADGRFVAFTSFASNLVADDANGVADAFLYDVHDGTLIRVTRANDGSEIAGNVTVRAISDSGRFVLFESDDASVVPEDTNGMWDVFLYDRIADVMTRISVNSLGEEGNGTSWDADIN